MVQMCMLVAHQSIAAKVVKYTKCSENATVRTQNNAPSWWPRSLLALAFYLYLFIRQIIGEISTVGYILLCVSDFSKTQGGDMEFFSM